MRYPQAPLLRLSTRRPPRPTLFPYTTLFRSGVDGSLSHAHVTRLAPQPCAAAVRAGQIAAVPAQKDADVGPVLLSFQPRSEEHTSELQSQSNLVCRLLLEKNQRTRPGTTPGR